MYEKCDGKNILVRKRRNRIINTRKRKESEAICSSGKANGVGVLRERMENKKGRDQKLFHNSHTEVDEKRLTRSL